jgi:AraC-like DNA-binding protein
VKRLTLNTPRKIAAGPMLNLFVTMKPAAFLSDASGPVAEIAHRPGDNNAANFTHAFRRWTGESPTRYRRNEARNVFSSMAVCASFPAAIEDLLLRLV